MLWRKAAEIGHHPLLRIRDLCERLGVRNIEDLLTAITLAQAAMGNRTTLEPSFQGLSAGDKANPTVKNSMKAVPLTRRCDACVVVTLGCQMPSIRVLWTAFEIPLKPSSQSW